MIELHPSHPLSAFPWHWAPGDHWIIHSANIPYSRTNTRSRDTCVSRLYLTGTSVSEPKLQKWDQDGRMLLRNCAPWRKRPSPLSDLQRRKGNKSVSYKHSSVYLFKYTIYFPFKMYTIFYSNYKASFQSLRRPPSCPSNRNSWLRKEASTSLPALVWEATVLVTVVFEDHRLPSTTWRLFELQPQTSVSSGSFLSPEPKLNMALLLHVRPRMRSEVPTSIWIGPSRCVRQGFSTVPILRPFKTVPHVVATPNHKITFLATS